MHDEVRMSYIGLSVGEIRVLKSIFALSPQLSENYVLVPPEYLKESDVVLVNADEERAIGLWRRVKAVNKVATALMLTTNSQLDDNNIVIQRPIRVQKLIAALEEIVNGLDREALKHSQTGSASALRVLIVDDSFPVRTYMEHKLAELLKVPLNVTSVSSGEEAIEKTRQHKFDIVFLDVVMEGVDGYKVCKVIKSQQKVHIVLLTSRKSPFDKVRGTMSGCDAYVTKPPPDERLVEEIRKSLEKRKSSASLGQSQNTGF